MNCIAEGQSDCKDHQWFQNGCKDYKMDVKTIYSKKQEYTLRANSMG